MPPVEIQVHTIWTFNDFTGKYPLERPLGVFTASVRILTWKDPISTDNSLAVLLSSWNYGDKYAKYKSEAISLKKSLICLLLQQ